MPVLEFIIFVALDALCIYIIAKDIKAICGNDL